MPNTYTMQEIVRNSVDWYTEERENGGRVDTPLISRIPKGLIVYRSCRTKLTAFQGPPYLAAYRSYANTTLVSLSSHRILLC